MDYTHFKEIVDEVKRKNPHLFELEHDQILSMTEIDVIEKKMNIRRNGRRDGGNEPWQLLE